MALMSTYTVRAKRWKHGWELHIDGVGVTQSRNLADAAREAIAEAEQALRPAAARSRHVARQLKQEGLSGRDIAAILHGAASIATAQEPQHPGALNRSYGWLG